MDSSACSHLFVHHPRPEQSEGQSTRAPRARLPLSLGDITASQCRSHFKLISLCMMFFKSFLNKTEIQRLFPGVWEQRRGPECALKKLLRRVHWGVLQQPHASASQQSDVLPPGTSGVWEGHCGKVSLETGHRGCGLGHLQQLSSSEGKPEFNSIRSC